MPGSRRHCDYGEANCQSLTGRVLDDLVARQILKVLEPASLELSMSAAADMQRERAELHQQWRQRLDARLPEGPCRAAVPCGRAGEPPGGPGIGTALGAGDPGGTHTPGRLHQLRAPAAGRCKRGGAESDRPTRPGYSRLVAGGPRPRIRTASASCGIWLNRSASGLRSTPRCWTSRSASPAGSPASTNCGGPWPAMNGCTIINCY